MRNQLERYRQIGEVLSRHGLGFIVGLTGLGRFVPFHRGVLGHERRPQPYTTPEHLRLAIEELGPTFIKLGQLLSTRSDIVPAAYLRELSKLQDSAPPVAPAVISELVEQELGAKPDQVFASFTAQPLASASIGQAHLATLPDGTEVVVKVRRPQINEVIETDLAILQNLANRVSRRWEAAENYNLPGLVSDFAVSLRRELDYLSEGRNAERFAANFAADPDVHIPRVFWATTTARVLTLERITGTKVDNLAALDRAGVDRSALATKAAGVAVRMVFEDGFFHADPHPGNLFIEPDGRIGLIDFGMVGEVDDGLRHHLATVLAALTSHDVDKLARALIELSVVKRQMDREQFRTDLVRFVALYRGRRLGEVNIAALVSHLLGLLRKHRLQLPQEMAVLLKFFLMIEGMGVRLDPDFNLGAFLGPYARQLLLDRYTPEALLRQLVASGQDAASLAVDLPDRVRRLFDLLDASGVSVNLRATEFEPLIERAERIGDRLVAGIVAAAFIRGISELASADKERFGRWEGPLMGIGLGMGGALGAYLGWTGRRLKRRPRH
ncbi:MAG TPA: AarF/UbiB family protein [Propionibacteriaceae bacterium]|nr:AarF/UbiB family protein [Propionibacteriaceae bacterium]